MADVQRRLRTLQAAIKAFAATPGRRGREVSLTDAEDVLIAGDLHGNLHNLRRLMERAELPRHSCRHFVVQELVHGHSRYPGGGDKSHQLVDVLAALKVQYPNRVHFLIGNHELAQATSRRVGKDGGVMNDRFRAGIDEAYGEHADGINALYLELFAIAPLAVRTANRVLLTHSLPPAARLACFNPAVLHVESPPATEFHPGGSIYSLVWGRDASEDAAAGFLKMMDADWLITGHIPCGEGVAFPNSRQIILDAQGHNAGYCLFPAQKLLSLEELKSCVATI